MVYAVDLSGLAAPPASWAALLGPEEWARAERLVNARDRLSFVAAHAAKRLAIAEADPLLEPQALRFVTDDAGKPRLEPPGPAFSLSHTRGMAAVAVWRGGSLGVDVEALDQPAATQELASAVFTAAERAALEREPAWTPAFLALWTAKEAALKAEGQGLALDPRRVIVGNGHAVGPSGRWRLWQTRPSPAHVLALAWMGDGEMPAFRVLDAEHFDAWCCGRA